MNGCGVLRMAEIGRICQGLGGTVVHSHVNSLVNSLMVNEGVSGVSCLGTGLPPTWARC